MGSSRLIYNTLGEIEMDIDWSKAPEGTTHYCELGQVFMNLPSEDACHRCIPRPQKPEAEWDRWKVGDVVQTGPNSPRHKVEWTNGDDVLISEIGRPYEVELTKWDLIMPARTQEQRQRDELVDFVAAASGIRARDGRGAIALDIADAILSRYNLEPKDV